MFRHNQQAPYECTTLIKVYSPNKCAFSPAGGERSVLALCAHCTAESCLVLLPSGSIACTPSYNTFWQAAWMPYMLGRSSAHSGLQGVVEHPQQTTYWAQWGILTLEAAEALSCTMSV
jgi:hypothetical protein